MLSSNVQIFDNEVRRTSATTRESWREGDFFVGVLYRNMCIYLFQKESGLISSEATPFLSMVAFQSLLRI